MILNVKCNQKISSKKFDYVKIAYILNHFKYDMSANQINYWFNLVFSNTYCNGQRISQVVKQYPEYFQIIPSINSSSPRTYASSIEIILHPTTKRLWRLKFENISY